MGENESGAGRNNDDGSVVIERVTNVDGGDKECEQNKDGHEKEGEGENVEGNEEAANESREIVNNLGVAEQVQDENSQEAVGEKEKGNIGENYPEDGFGKEKEKIDENGAEDDVEKDKEKSDENGADDDEVEKEKEK